MSSSKCSRELSRKASFSPKKTGGDLLGFELLYQLAYMSAISAAGIPRSQIFKLASKLPCGTAGYFYEVDRLAQSMNYQYAEACRLVGESTKEEEVKSLLLRMAGSLSSGETEMDFLNHEAQIQAESYGNIYERKLESLKKWTDAYSALIVSAALIIVVAAISTVIYDMGTTFVVGLVAIMIGVSGLGAWIIYRTAPREIKTLSGEMGKVSQKTPQFFFLTFFPGSLAIGAMLFVAGAPFGLVLLSVGALLVPIGMVAARYDGEVTKKDGDISTFLRVVGSTATAIGTTPTEALTRIDLRSTASLTDQVKRLYARLKARASPERCWQRFAAETGSELINRGVRVFIDGVSLGGDPEEVGNRASVLTMKVNFMRAKRKLVSAGFGWLSLALHATVVFLLVFVIEIVGSFGDTIQKAGITETAMGGGAAATSVLSFSFQNMEFLRWLMTPVVIVLSLINATAAKVADGGYVHKFFLYLGLALSAAGLSVLIAPRLAAMVFGLSPSG